MQSATFARLPLTERIALLSQINKDYQAVAEDSVRASCHAKRIDFEGPQASEEWIGGPLVTLRLLRLMQMSLRDIQLDGVPRIPRSALRIIPNGQLSVKVYPRNPLDALTLPQHRAEIHMLEGVTADNLSQHQASFYRQPHGGKLCLVLGAGNVNSIAPCDCIYKMFVEGKVCILKMNPVNAYLGPYLERGFQAAIDRGYFAVVYGGADEGSHLVSLPEIDEVHITGSDKTHDALVWGLPGLERQELLRNNRPLLHKPITSELGNISPVIIVPGPYDARELVYQSANIAGMVANNASFNCNSAKLLVTSKDYPLRPQWIEGIKASLRQAGSREAYYPGAAERWKRFTDGRKNIEIIGDLASGRLPYAVIEDVDPELASDLCFTEEPWCTVLSETALPELEPMSFLEQAVDFLNERVWGTLCATVIVHPTTLEDPDVARVFERAISRLQYGTVAINTWAGAGYALGTTPWGGHPSSSSRDIQSGKGWVHNTLMLEKIEKCVVRGPLRGLLKLPWFPDHQNALAVARALVEWEKGPSWLKAPALGRAALL